VRGEIAAVDAVRELADRIRHVPEVVSVECRLHHEPAGGSTTGPSPR
jgi:hypothetical protein